MLSEMRILLPGAQMLSAFLIILPFNGGFAQIVHSEKLLFLATFFLSLTSLVLLSAPAIQHRLMRPLKDRARFKRMATRQIVAGALALAIAPGAGNGSGDFGSVRNAGRHGHGWTHGLADRLRLVAAADVPQAQAIKRAAKIGVSSAKRTRALP
jgi:hypothetical protein